MEQSEVELNEKLARWAGFTQAEKAGKTDWHYEAGGKRVPNWHAPDGYTHRGQFDRVGWTPDFRNDISACFKWLVPKLVQVQLVITPGLRNSASVYIDPHNRQQSMFEAEGGTPTIALCRAISAMIDAEHPA